jgi:hypothetical protein
MRQKHDHWRMARKAHHQKVLRKDASANVRDSSQVIGFSLLLTESGLCLSQKRWGETVARRRAFFTNVRDERFRGFSILY